MNGLDLGCGVPGADASTSPLAHDVRADVGCHDCGAVPVENASFCTSCGRRLPCGFDRSTWIDERYILGAELGHGAMGVVHRAEDVELARPVALKLISPAVGRRPELLAQFRREARALAAINNDHVVRIYSFGVHESSLYFAMELVQGPNLASLIDAELERDALLPIHQTLHILERVAGGLDAVHAVGLVHRDVKPENILVEDQTGRPVLVDFGLALAPARGSGEHLLAGTPSYMAPEHVDGHPPASSNDLYALASTAYEMLTGSIPLDGGSALPTMQRHLNEDAPTLSLHRPDLVEADPVFARALSRDPQMRHRDCCTFVAELEAAVGARWRSPGIVSTPPAASDGRLVVLVVDADAEFARLCARAAGITFHDVPSKITIAATLEDAVERAHARPPHLVLYDPSTFGVDGLDAGHHIRRASALQPKAAVPRVDVGKPHMVAVCPPLDAGRQRRLFASGVDEVLQKPLDFPQLLRAMQTIAVRVGFNVTAAPLRARR